MLMKRVSVLFWAVNQRPFGVVFWVPFLFSSFYQIQPRPFSQRAERQHVFFLYHNGLSLVMHARRGIKPLLLRAYDRGHASKQLIEHNAPTQYLRTHIIP